MTKQRNNRLIDASDGARSSSVNVGGEIVPTGIEDYCGWLNRQERRAGRWVIVEHQGRRAVDFRVDSGTGEWLRTRGMVPQIGKAA